MSNKNKSKRALLIANPGSGTGTATSRMALIQEITGYLQDAGVKVDVSIAKPKEAATPIARRAVKDGYRSVIAMGGDDTVEAIMRAVSGSKTRLGIISAGTANNLAKSLGIPQDHKEACALIATGKSRKLDMGQIRVKKGKKLLFFEAAVIGVLAALYPDAEDVRKGEITKIKDAVVTLIQHQSKPKVTLEMDGHSNITIETMLVTIANVPLIGQNFLVAPDASSGDGLFDICLYPEFNKAELTSYFSKVANMGHATDGSIQRYRSKRIKIKTSPKLEVLASGVMMGKGSVEIKVLAGALRVIAPKPGAGVERPQTKVSKKLPAPVARAVVDDSVPTNGKVPVSTL